MSLVSKIKTQNILNIKMKIKLEYLVFLKNFISSRFRYSQISKPNEKMTNLKKDDINNFR